MNEPLQQPPSRRQWPPDALTPAPGGDDRLIPEQRQAVDARLRRILLCTMSLMISIFIIATLFRHNLFSKTSLTVRNVAVESLGDRPDGRSMMSSVGIPSCSTSYTAIFFKTGTEGRKPTFNMVLPMNPDSLTFDEIGRKWKRLKTKTMTPTDRETFLRMLDVFLDHSEDLHDACLAMRVRMEFRLSEADTRGYLADAAEYASMMAERERLAARRGGLPGKQIDNAARNRFAGTLLTLANEHFKEGDHLLSLSLYDNIISRFPDTEAAYAARYQMILCASSFEERDVAISMADELLGNDSWPAGSEGIKADVERLRITMLFNEGRTEQALIASLSYAEARPSIDEKAEALLNAARLHAAANGPGYFGKANLIALKGKSLQPSEGLRLRIDEFLREQRSHLLDAVSPRNTN